MQLFAYELKNYVPPVPLVYAASACHDTELEANHVPGCESESVIWTAMENLYREWPAGYHRTYCEGHAAPLDYLRGDIRCRAPASTQCCPYGGNQNSPPLEPMRGVDGCVAPKDASRAYQ